MRYSPLMQINRENVSRLKIAWVFHTGDISDGKGQQRRSGFETTPILVEGTLEDLKQSRDPFVERFMREAGEE